MKGWPPPFWRTWATRSTNSLGEAEWRRTVTTGLVKANLFIAFKQRYVRRLVPSNPSDRIPLSRMFWPKWLIASARSSAKKTRSRCPAFIFWGVSSTKPKVKRFAESVQQVSDKSEWKKLSRIIWTRSLNRSQRQSTSSWACSSVIRPAVRSCSRKGWRNWSSRPQDRTVCVEKRA